MDKNSIKKRIQIAIEGFAQKNLSESAINLFNVLGYNTSRQNPFIKKNCNEFKDLIAQDRNFNEEKALCAEWNYVDLLFQLSQEEILEQGTLFDTKQVDNTIIETYLFFVISLNGERYSRTVLANITREINKLFPMPVMLLFKHGKSLTFSIINRRLHKRDPSKDVLEKVTLIKDIRIENPHRAHIEILYDLSFNSLINTDKVTNFVELHRAWKRVLDTNELNRKFFQEISNWYFWAVNEVEFPDDAEKDRTKRNSISVIRLITRLMFVWFIKEKELVNPQLFDKTFLDKILNYSDVTDSTYYKAILQNLFFATLNTEMNRDKPGNRRFVKNQYLVHSLYRYDDLFKDKTEALKFFENTPFLNGGLFECLDRKGDDEKVIRIDCFSNNPKNRKRLKVPDYLFFGKKQLVDLSEVYDNKKKNKVKVRPIIDILNSYKFTVAENTPIEEEVALDPELLGKVFENLLASYNPETKMTARKQTGSFYTPREIVNYMVDESLITYFTTELNNKFPEQNKEVLQTKLRQLFEYNEKPHDFNENEVNVLINAIDNIKVLDPAAGSGAFPMGVLHRLVFLLHKLDPHNEKWKQKQIDKISEIEDPAIREQLLEDVEESFENNEIDYGRKLYLIENCIYGVDIQPVAIQIAKLRFFISLVVEQKVNFEKKNFGIRPLPNLETKFVAANTLIGINKPENATFRNPEIEKKEKELNKIRERYFTARTHETKEKYRQLDKKIRNELADLLKKDGFETPTTEMLAKWNPYDQNTSAPFFEPEWMFGIKNGFDIVIGNPPYVRADSGEEYLKFRQKLIKSNQYETLYEKWDLYIPFMERGFKLLKEKGIITYIIPSAYLTSKYAIKSRQFFLEKSRIDRIDFLMDLDIFEATVKNIIFQFSKNSSENHMPLRFKHSGNFGEVKKLETDLQKLLKGNVFNEKIIKEIKFEDTIEWGNIFYVSYGLRPNADERKAKGLFKKSDLISETQDAIHSKKYIEGKDIKAYKLEKIRYLEWNTERCPKMIARPTFEELYLFPKIIRGRMTGAIYDNNGLISNDSTFLSTFWHNLRNVQNRSINNSVAKDFKVRGKKAIALKRIELMEISKKFEIKYCLAILNSKFAKWFFNRVRRSAIGLYPDDLKKLPVKLIPKSEQKFFSFLVDIIISLKAKNTKITRTFFEEVIDVMVLELYFHEQLKERKIDILKYVKQDLNHISKGKVFEEFPDLEKEEVSKKLLEKWTSPQNEIAKRISMFKEKSPDIIKPILEI